MRLSEPFLTHVVNASRPRCHSKPQLTARTRDLGCCRVRLVVASLQRPRRPTRLAGSVAELSSCVCPLACAGRWDDGSTLRFPAVVLGPGDGFAVHHRPVRAYQSHVSQHLDQVEVDGVSAAWPRRPRSGCRPLRRKLLRGAMQHPFTIPALPSSHTPATVTTNRATKPSARVMLTRVTRTNSSAIVPLAPHIPSPLEHARALLVGLAAFSSALPTAAGASNPHPTLD